MSRSTASGILTPMLHYLGHGERQLGLRNSVPHERGRWEFMAVLRGRISPVLEDMSQPGMREQSLWVFQPRVRHAWTAQGEDSAEVIVVHVSDVPDQLKRATKPRGFVRADLTASDGATLRDLRADLSRELTHPTDLTDVVVQRALMELTLLALRDVKRKPVPIGLERERAIVDAALSHFKEHMESSPSFEQVCRQVGMSPGHLRRLFSKVLNNTPREAFNQARIERAMSLLNQTDAALEEIAQTCGFSQTSALSRAFQRQTGVSPGRWRQSYDFQDPLDESLRKGWRR